MARKRGNASSGYVSPRAAAAPNAESGAATLSGFGSRKGVMERSARHAGD